MMQGYWNRPDLTERAFYRRSPYPSFTEVFYRSGDLVKKLADGNYLFMGRKDRQVKIRGYRVELDEVEAAMVADERVAEGAAVMITDDMENRHIEAGVLLRDGVTANEKDLLLTLKARLPSYAVPQTIRILQSFPRTGTGKIDRRALGRQFQTRRQE
jgi:acyl-coenzyme A synthetase/AMP-(fatty) acid ligase